MCHDVIPFSPEFSEMIVQQTTLLIGEDGPNAVASEIWPHLWQALKSGKSLLDAVTSAMDTALADQAAEIESLLAECADLRARLADLEATNQQLLAA